MDGENWSDAGLENLWNLTGLGEGAHTFGVMAIDNAGNLNVSMIEFTYENPSTPAYVTVWIAIGLALIAAVGLVVLLLYRMRT